LLKHIDPLLSPELLKILAEMGHEDAIVLADANFTAMRYRDSTTSQTVVRLPGVGLARAAQAVLSVLPLGIAAEMPVAYMQVTEAPAGQASKVQQEVINLVQADAAHADIKAQAVERFAFYERAKLAYVIVQTGEQQPYANFIFKKGVITRAQSD
jgi:L-fucose mutarotase